MPQKESTPFSPSTFFTNRQGPVALFLRFLQEVRNREYSVLCYHGIGGIGKSRLMEELMLRAVQDEGVISTVRVDFYEKHLRAPDTAIFEIYTKLKKQGLSFPSFEIAYGVLWQKRNPEKQLQASTLPFVEDSSIAFDVLSIMQDVPVLGLVPKLMTLLHRFNKATERWVYKIGESTLKEMVNREPHEIEAALPYYFAKDLEDELDSDDTRIVICLDTYEALWPDHADRKTERFLSMDEWVRKLVANTPKVLWVICGRERLQWERKAKEGWAEVIEHCELGELKDTDAELLLINSNIAEKEIRDLMISTSRGLPFHLRLQIQTYQTVLREGRRPLLEDFADTYYEILNRFVRYLSPAEIETLKMLSFSGSWNYDLFSFCVQKFSTGYPITSFVELMSFSFISEIGAQVYQMHSIMGDHFISSSDPVISRKIHEKLYNYHLQKIALNRKENGDVKFTILTDDSLMQLLNAARHYQAISTAFVFAEWLHSTCEEVVSRSILLHDLLANATEQLIGEDEMFVKMKLYLLVMRLAHWQDHEKRFKDALEKGAELSDHLNLSSLEFGKDDTEKVRMFTSLLEHQGLYLMMIENNLWAIKFLSAAYDRSYYDGTQINMSYLGNALMQIGKLPLAEYLFSGQMKYAREDHDYNMIGFYYRQLAIIANALEADKHSVVFAEKNCHYKRMAFGESSREFQLSKQTLAILLINVGYYQRALDILISVVEWESSNLERADDSTSRNMFWIGQCRVFLGDWNSGFTELLSYLDFVISYTPAYKIADILRFLEIVQKTILIEVSENKIRKDLKNKVLSNYKRQFRKLNGEFPDLFDTCKWYFSIFGKPMDLYIKVFIYHYTTIGDHAALKIVQQRENEIKRLNDMVFHIRTVGQAELIDQNLNRELYQEFLEEVGYDTDIDFQLSSYNLPFFRTTKLFKGYFSGNYVKYAMRFKNRYYTIDWNGFSIFEVALEDFILSEESVKDYLFFYYDSFSILNGRLQLPENIEHAAFRLDKKLSDEDFKTVTDTFAKLSIIESTKEYIKVQGTGFLNGTVNNMIFKINSNGSIEEEYIESYFENVPVAIDVSDSYLYGNEFSK